MCGFLRAGELCGRRAPRCEGVVCVCVCVCVKMGAGTRACTHMHAYSHACICLRTRVQTHLQRLPTCMHLGTGRHAGRADAHDAGRGIFSLTESERIATESLPGCGRRRLLEENQRCLRGCRGTGLARGLFSRPPQTCISCASQQAHQMQNVHACIKLSVQRAATLLSVTTGMVLGCVVSI